MELKEYSYHPEIA